MRAGRFDTMFRGFKDFDIAKRFSLCLCRNAFLGKGKGGKIPLFCNTITAMAKAFDVIVNHVARSVFCLLPSGCVNIKKPAGLAMPKPSV